MSAFLLTVIRRGWRRVFRLNKLKPVFYHPIVESALRLFIGVTFVFASYHKMVEPAHFAKIIYGYYLFPDFSINLLAIGLPYLEFFCGLALMLGVYPRSAALIINMMLAGFIVAISINLIRGHEFDCGCFSFGEPGYTSSARQLLLRNIGYLMMGVYVLFYQHRRILCVRQSGSFLKDLSIS